MILLDTNILSELMRRLPSQNVIAWINNYPTEEIYISSITIAEIRYGISVLPQGAKRDLLETKFKQFVHQAFVKRVLSFDEEAANVYGSLMGYRKTLGKPMSMVDGQIASIALTHNLSIATRNIKDFHDCEINIVNPF